MDETPEQSRARSKLAAAASLAVCCDREPAEEHSVLQAVHLAIWMNDNYRWVPLMHSNCIGLAAVGAVSIVVGRAARVWIASNSR